MTDDLWLELEQDVKPKSHRSRRARRGRRRVVVGFIVLAVIAIIGGGAVAVGKVAIGIFGAPADYAGAGFGNVTVQVHQGDTVTAIGQTLEHADVVHSVRAFTNAASSNPKATSIGPGFYQLHKHMKASLALGLMLDPASLVQSRVAIPEGWTLKQILRRTSADANIPLRQLRAAAASPASLGVPTWGQGHPLEGFLFPATYTFPPHTTAKQALTTMVTRFNQEADSLRFAARAHKRGLSPYRLLVMASLVQGEGRLPADFPKIAEVFYNRLHRGMTLASDAALVYVLPHHRPPNGSDLKLDSPYNTRLHTGLPPTPINSPGSEAMAAALHPAVGPLLYFVTIDKAGHTAFTTNLADFNRLVAKSRRNGVH